MKICIVGAGINGSYLAWKLANEHDVTIFEQRGFIGKQVCSGMVSERIWNFIPKNEKLIENYINEAILHYTKKNVKLLFSPRFIILEHAELDRYVAELAEKNGAKIELNKPVKRVFALKNSKPQISVEDEIYEFDYIIGADGPLSVVRKCIGIKDPNFRLGIYTYVEKEDKSNKVDIWPFKNGFFWKIPRGNKIEYGIIDSVSTAKTNFEKICRSKKIRIGKLYSQLIPQSLVETQKNRVALVGDACGLTKPWSGGGIIWGLTADDILLKTFPNLSKYSESIRRFFEAKIFFSKLFMRLAYEFADKLPFLLPKEINFDSDWVF